MKVHPNNLVEKFSGNSSANSTVQARLEVGAVNDPLEHEADALADQVMRMPENGLIQRKCSQCEEEDRAQRKPLASFIQKKGVQGGIQSSESISNRIQNSRGKGNKLSENTRVFMESRFGTEFSNVNVHAGSEAAELSQNLGAKAFTVGNDIYFNASQYAPGTDEGKHLLAHELTHTLQQTSIIQKQSQPQQPPPGFHPEVNIDPHSAEIILTQAVRALGNFRLRGHLTEPLNVISDVTGTPLGLPSSTLDISLAYNDRCNRALQSFFLGVNQRQTSGQPVFDFSQADWTASAGGGFRLGSLRIDASGNATFNGDQFQALSFALTFTTGVSQAIPAECRNTPSTNGRDPSTPEDRTLCESIDCSVPATIANSALHGICCVGSPNTDDTPVTPQLPTRTVYFFYDTPIFKTESNDTLAQVLDTMRVLGSVQVQITGHTSLEGTETYNQGLSERRAQAVRTYLELHGIDSSRIQLLSMGENAPAVVEPAEPNSQSLRLPGNEAIRDLNRRAEVVFFDPTGTHNFLPTSPPMILTLPSRRGDGFNLLPAFQPNLDLTE